MTNDFWAFAVGVPLMDDEEEVSKKELMCVVCGWTNEDETEFLDDGDGQHMCWSCVYLMEK